MEQVCNLSPHFAPPRADKLILVVDDEPDILESLEELIGAQMPHVRVLTAHSGVKGLLIVVAHPALDMILSDFHMPEMDGLEFLRRARELRAEIPMVIMTADTHPDLAAEAMRLAAVKIVVPKPLDPVALVEMLEFFLGKFFQGGHIPLREKGKAATSPQNRGGTP